MPSIWGAIVPWTLLTARLTLLPPYRCVSPSLSSSASRLPVEAPEGTAARPHAPDSSWTSASTVGYPRESRISRAYTPVIADTSGPPFVDEVGQRGDGPGGGPQRHQRDFGVLDELPSAPARGLEAVQGGIGRLLLALIAAGGLAELFEAALDVEDIIHDLERDPERLAGACDGLESVGLRTGQHGAHAQRRPDERGRLARVDVIERLGADRLALGLDVHDLPADHAVGAGRLRDLRHHVGNDPRVRRAVDVAGDQPERVREQRVAGQDGHRLAEHLVIGEPAAAIVVVVHRGQVVVDQRIRMDQLERARRGQHALGHAADGLAAGDDENGAQALAARHHAVAHGPVDRRRWRVLRREDTVERLVDEAPAVVDVRLEVEVAHASRSGSHANGRVPRLPASSLARTSMRRSASSRYAAQRRASDTPSS